MISGRPCSLRRSRPIEGSRLGCMEHAFAICRMCDACLNLDEGEARNGHGLHHMWEDQSVETWAHGVHIYRSSHFVSL